MKRFEFDFEKFIKSPGLWLTLVIGIPVITGIANMQSVDKVEATTPTATPAGEMTAVCNDSGERVPDADGHIQIIYPQGHRMLMVTGEDGRVDTYDSDSWGLCN